FTGVLQESRDGDFRCDAPNEVKVSTYCGHRVVSGAVPVASVQARFGIDHSVVAHVSTLTVEASDLGQCTDAQNLSVSAVGEDAGEHNRFA
ncbi:hypothetical protein ABTK28_20535, partial [Acinetobacter baumannii]